VQLEVDKTDLHRVRAVDHLFPDPDGTR